MEPLIKPESFMGSRINPQMTFVLRQTFSIYKTHKVRTHREVNNSPDFKTDWSQWDHTHRERRLLIAPVSKCLQANHWHICVALLLVCTDPFRLICRSMWHLEDTYNTFKGKRHVNDMVTVHAVESVAMQEHWRGCGGGNAGSMGLREQQSHHLSQMHKKTN